MSGEKISLEVLGSRRLTITAELRDMQHRMSVLEYRFTALENRFTAMEGRLGGIETRLSAIENRIGAVEERMSAMLGLIIRIAERVVPLG